MIAVAIVPLLFAVFALGGTIVARKLSARLERFEDGPLPGDVSPARLTGAAALLGAALAIRGADPSQIAVGALLCLSLAAIWYCDVRFGIIPDAFSLGALAIVAVGAVVLQQWFVLVSSAVVAMPFAAAAAASRGRGMGWGDVKLVALGGAVLGLEPAILAFGMACAAAAFVGMLQRRRSQAIALGPYLVSAIAFSAVLVP